MTDRVSVDALVPKQEITSIFQVRSVQAKKTKAGKDYLSMTLGDKTGEVLGQVWDIGSAVAEKGRVFEPGFLVKVRAMVDVYNDVVQLNISKIRVNGTMPEDEFMPEEEFVKSSEVPPAILLGQVRAIVNEHSVSPIKSLLIGAIDSYDEMLVEAVAAKSVHHNYRGGLLEHILSLMKIGVGLADHYGLDKSKILFACLFHDIGKIHELKSNNGVIEYTLEGTLIGHVIQGLEVLDDVMKFSDSENIGDRTLVELRHLIASHHGRLDWGAAKVPASREAIVFHFMDMIDSRMAIFDAAVARDKSPGPMTPYNNHLESFLLKPEIPE